ncbi:hypothetical protein CXG81DRAFT_10657 [Caulochytrium protostelioides]|uniref:Serine/threonine-protein kinase ATR n=1 Tax=Caulochytrium protostelioides TaxID=1555241 RepID=A0A4P9XAW9_9FUNG|nr:hypothetical protein CXG81DRAFT_10657 [Caulochytrium protostelioides]|eukprot:RKP02527.1 hypothetical protein CXG81DRAFT_10657 [Caulochytrium protostelioides]
MEFAGIISRLLQRDEQSRGRGLRIRTYAVTPISEECGLIQWVPATTGFRIIVQQRYTARGMGLPSSAIRAIAERRGKDWNKRLHAFVHDLLPPHPPIFYTWFHEMFGTPQRWLAARSRYAATMATMSIVGWIIGLGDRHGENILFDEKSGDCVHVDLNCLFEKGLTLAEPELVPFRLTHNLTDALGVTGVEGPFRRGCESVYRVMREHRDALNAVLETFLHDPLCEWGKSLRFAAGHTGSLVEKQQAMEVEQAAKALATIDRKLLGIDKVSIPLSVEGQVQELIRAATDVNLLAQMYIGWGSYL